MSVKHIARSGKTYYLHAIAGANGKTRSFFSTSSEGLLAPSIPDGYEIYENVNAQVFLRRKTIPLIQDDEIDLIRTALGKQGPEWKHKVEIKKAMIVIHQAGQDYDALERRFSSWMDGAKMERFKIQSATYMPIMRFILQDNEKRIFWTERYCFRGSIDDWIRIGQPGKLTALSKQFIKHLGRESFFELM